MKDSKVFDEWYAIFSKKPHSFSRSHNWSNLNKMQLINHCNRKMDSSKPYQRRAVIVRFWRNAAVSSVMDSTTWYGLFDWETGYHSKWTVWNRELLSLTQVRESLYYVRGRQHLSVYRVLTEGWIEFLGWHLKTPKLICRHQYLNTRYATKTRGCSDGVLSVPKNECFVTIIRGFDLMMSNVPKQLSRAMRRCVLCHMRTTKVQISLRIRAVWSAPLLFAA